MQGRSVSRVICPLCPISREVYGYPLCSFHVDYALPAVISAADRPASDAFSNQLSALFSNYFYFMAKYLIQVMAAVEPFLHFIALLLPSPAD
jgi:hypothetical protein